MKTQINTPTTDAEEIEAFVITLKAIHKKLCTHPRDRIKTLSANRYKSLGGTHNTRSPENFKTFGRWKYGSWIWCSACGSLGALDGKDKLTWKVPNV